MVKHGAPDGGGVVHLTLSQCLDTSLFAWKREESVNPFEQSQKKADWHC